ncbi:MAG: xylulokinase [Chloroflexota bacterium]|nr:MAG: xylulokinase [Chloroflexota bacterium]
MYWSSMALLGIDLGTSSVKALVVDENGRILGQGAAEYAIDRPRPEWAEQSPEAWWQATVIAVRAALTGLGERSREIAAIGLSGQMHGTVLMDGSGALLNPAVIWPDRRSLRQVKQITAAIGARRLIRLAGSPLAAGFQAATIRWFKEERPELWSKVKTVLLPKDYLRWRLTGELGTEPSDGSGALLVDVQERAWSLELLAALDLDAILLPPVAPSTAVAGHLASGPAGQLGLTAGIPVVYGAADTACGLLGAGVVDEGDFLLTIGSGGQLVAPASKVQVDLKGRLHTFCGALEPTESQPGWYQMAAILSAGLSLRWLRDQLFALQGADAYQKMTAMAETASPGANGLLFLPYLLGERTPHMDPRARGLFLGLTASHGRAELVRSVMEGVALACYDAYSVLNEVGVQPDHIIMAGGGARSPLWRQIVADVFNLPVRPLVTEEQAALGAALLAGAGLDLFRPLATAREWARYGPAVEPQIHSHDRYRQLLAIFRAAYQKHRQDFEEIGNLDDFS